MKHGLGRTAGPTVSHRQRLQQPFRGRNTESARRDHNRPVGMDGAGLRNSSKNVVGQLIGPAWENLEHDELIGHQ